MSFKPIQVVGRQGLGVRLGYRVKTVKTNGYTKLRISICAEHLQRMGVRDGDYVRLDVDATTGQSRLVLVRGAMKAARRLRVSSGSTGRGLYEMPWTGEVPTFFPAVPEMTELVLCEVKSEELVFELPVAARKEGGAVV